MRRQGIVILLYIYADIRCIIYEITQFFVMQHYIKDPLLVLIHPHKSTSIAITRQNNYYHNTILITYRAQANRICHVGKQNRYCVVIRGTIYCHFKNVTL